MDNKNLTGRKFWTLRYTLINVTYFAAFCTIHAYAAVYLLAHGFTNTEVGILLAVANVLSAILQPIVAGVIDKPGWLTNRRFILISVTIMLAGNIILMLVNDNKIIIFAVFALIYMVQFVYQPVMTAMCFEYQKSGCNIYYGLARGLGSAGFAVTSAFIGGAVENYGVFVLLIVNVVVMVLSIIIVFTFKMPENTGTVGSPDEEKPDNKNLVAHNNIKDFTRTYPAFMLFLVGTICFFFAHNMINDFLIQIIRNLGGGETEMGYATFLAAILELPVMAFIGLVLKKISADKLLLFSGVSFLIKTVIMLMAGSLVMMFVSQSWQFFAYAVFIPASAYYVSNTMEELDQVKGQAYISSAITVGGVFSNLISGWILDKSGVGPMLLTGSIVCAIGVLVAFVAMLKLPHHVTEKA